MRSTLRVAAPTIKPRRMPVAVKANCRSVSLQTKVPVTTAPIAVRYSTSAVASLTKLSPSRIVTRRRGMPSRRAMAVAATASGGETMAPSMMAAAQLSPGNSQCAMAATAAVVAKTSPTASMEIGRRLARNSRRDVKYAAAHRIGGRKTRKIRSEFKRTVGKPGIKARTRPPMTNNMG